MKALITIVLALVLASPAAAFSWRIKLGSEASFELAVVEGGDAIRIGQFELAGATWRQFDAVTDPVLDVLGLPIPNPLAIVRPVFYERPAVEEGAE